MRSVKDNLAKMAGSTLVRQERGEDLCADEKSVRQNAYNGGNLQIDRDLLNRQDVQFHQLKLQQDIARAE